MSPPCVYVAVSAQSSTDQSYVRDHAESLSRQPSGVDGSFVDLRHRL